MKVFLCYSSEQRALAEELAQRLKSSDIDVFFDRESLVPGDPFDMRIRQALSRADMFVFLASRDSLRQGAYALSELDLAQKRWPKATGRILTVLIGDTSIASLPAYLQSVSVLQPAGDVIAETTAAISRVAQRWRRSLFTRIAVGILIAAVSAGLWTLGPWRTKTYDLRSPSVAKVKDGFRFTGTLRNGGPEAVTSVNLYPEAKSSNVKFSGSIDWFRVQPGEEKVASVVHERIGASDGSRFDWRLCWTFVKSLDVDMAKDMSSIDMFIEQRSQTICSSYRAWPQ